MQAVRNRWPFSVLLLVFVWVVVVTATAVVEFVRIYERTGRVDVALLALLCVPALVGLAASAVAAWVVAGREEIRVSAGRLVLAQRLGQFSAGSAYSPVDIRRLRVARQSVDGNSPWHPFLRASSLAFDYGASSVYFARDIDEAEAFDLLPTLKRRLEAAGMRIDTV